MSATFYALLQILSDSPHIPAIGMAASPVKNPTSFIYVQPDRASTAQAALILLHEVPMGLHLAIRHAQSEKVKLPSISGRRETDKSFSLHLLQVSCAERHFLRPRLRRSPGIKQLVAPSNS